MASDKRQTSKGNKDDVRQGVIGQQEHIVPTMTTHFESVAMQGQDTENRAKTEESSIDGQEGQEERERERERQQPSFEETTKLRQTAQQNSAEAIRAAEERYNQAKETAAQKAQQAKELAAQKGQETKETAAQKAQEAKELAAQKAQQTKELAAQKAQKIKETTAEKTEQAKGTVSQAKEYVVEKAVAAKDVTAEKAEVAKDKAAATGWTAAHYTTEKTVDGTKAAAEAVKGAVEYVGSKASELVSKPLGAAKEVAVSTGESMKDYTARKKEEAERELETKQGTTTESQGTERSYWEGDEKEEERRSRGREGITEEYFEHDQDERQRDAKGGGVLEAIGETIAEIAQTTKEFVIGKGKNVSGEQGGDEFDEANLNK